MNEAVMYLLVGVVAVIAAILMVVLLSLSKKVSDIEIAIGRNGGDEVFRKKEIKEEIKDLSRHFYDWTITMSEALDNSRNAITMLEELRSHVCEIGAEVKYIECGQSDQSTCSCDLDQVGHIGSLLGDINEMVVKIEQEQEKISDKIKKLSEKKKKKDKGEVSEND